MEQPGVVAGSFAVSFSLTFLSIFVHISGSIRPITLIWASLQRSFPPADVEYILYMMPILVQSDDVRSERKAKVRHWPVRAAQESMGYFFFLLKQHFSSLSRNNREVGVK